MDHVTHRANALIAEHRAKVDQLTAWIDGIDEDKQQGLGEKLDAERALHLAEIDTLNHIKFAVDLLLTKYAHLMDDAPAAAAASATARPSGDTVAAALPSVDTTVVISASRYPGDSARSSRDTSAASAQCVKCGLVRERKYFSDEAWRSRTPVCETHDLFREAKRAKRA